MRRKGFKIAITLDDYERDLLAQLAQPYECTEPEALKIAVRVGLLKVHQAKVARLLEAGHQQMANMEEMRWKEGEL